MSKPLYDRPGLYDVAFGYRDVGRERDALLRWVDLRRGTTAPGRVLELGAGPADHALAFAERGWRAEALDLAPSMVEHARAQAEQRGLPLALHTADMTAFSLGATYDLVLLMLSSASHIHTLDAMIAHLRCVGAHLEPRGTYVMEMTHPRDFLGRGARESGISPPWRQERDGLSVETTWGHANDPYDPIAQLFEAHVELRVTSARGSELVREVVPMRDWTATEMDAAVRLAGGLRIAGRHGDFEQDVPLDGSSASWRMLLELERA
jgi:SAM-dependent methyltransferase